LLITLNLRLRDIQTFRETVDPYTKLLAMIPNQVATIMANLSYKEGAPWYLDVRNELERYLMAISVRETGLAVMSVLISNKPKDSAASRRFNMEDALAERRRRGQLADAAVQRTIKGEDLVSTANAAAQAYAAANSSEAAALLASQIEGGDQLIQRDIEMRRLEAATGSQMRISPLDPQQPQLAPGYGGPDATPALNPGYTGPDSNSTTYTFTPTADAAGTSGQPGSSVTAPFPGQPAGFGEPSPITGQFRPDTGPIGSTPTTDGQIDQQRLGEEVQRLTDAGYTADIDQQRKTVAANRADGTLAIMFYLDADYPITAPSQIMVNRARSGWQGFQSRVAAQWTPANSLSEIAGEIGSAGA